MIKLTEINKSFDKFTALDSINLEIEKGTAYGLLGSNGAGKSTLLRIMTGIYKADSGSAQIDGEEIYNNPKAKEKIFFVNDETVQFNKMTLKELKEYYKCFYSNFNDEIFERLWNVLKLPMDKRLATFSKGMKRQAVVICGIACCTEYLLLDEAFDGLDPTMRKVVKQMLVDAMIDNQLTVIISSHNMKEMEEFCDHAGLMHKGKLIFSKELDSAKSDIHKIQCAFDAPCSKEDFADIDILHFDRNESIVYIIAKGDKAEITEKINRHNPKLLDIIPLSLEEVFIYEMEGIGYDEIK